MTDKLKKFHIILTCVLLASATLAVYIQVYNHEFISFDDDWYIAENEHVLRGLSWEGFLWALTSSKDAYNWHPLTWLSHMLDSDFFGLSAEGRLLTNVFFHIANAILLFLILFWMTKNYWCSSFVAAVFALHPLHVESVAWASERKDVLSCFFWFLTMAAYVHYSRHPGFKRYVLVFMLFALGLLAKQMLITLPLVLLLIDFWPLKRIRLKTKANYNFMVEKTASATQCILEKIPLFVLSAIASSVVFLIQREAKLVKVFSEYSLFERIGNALVSYVIYIIKMFYPAGLAIFYPHPRSSLQNWQIAGSALLLVVITVLVILQTYKRPYLFFGWFWYLGTLVPVIGFVQVGMQAYADRYTYIPLVGLFIMAAWGISELLASWQYRKQVLAVSVTTVLIILAVMTFIQVGYWRNNITLYKHATEVVTDNWWAHNLLAGALMGENRTDEAIEHYYKTLQIDADLFQVRESLGNALISQNRPKESIELFQEAIAYLPNDREVVERLEKNRAQLKAGLDQYARSHIIIAKAFAKSGEIDKAVTHFKAALWANPDSIEARDNLVSIYNVSGIALGQQGKFNEAIAHFNAALKLAPHSAEIHSNIGYALIQTGNYDQAYDHLKQAIQLEPDNAMTHYQLGVILQSKGKIGEAIEAYYSALKNAPDWAELMDALARLLAAANDENFHNPKEAIRLAEKVCEITGYNQPEPLDTLAIAYAADGDFDKAIKFAEKALNIAQANQQNSLSKQIESRLNLYKSNTPYMERK